MDPHIRTLRKEELLLDHGGWFDEENAERVVSWLVAAEDRSPVVLVGAGFSLNARDRESGRPASQRQAPLWLDLVRRIAADLGVQSDRYDAPTLFEFYQEEFGAAKLRDALRALLVDEALVPGRAHEALATYPCEAIVTTNCLDTLLDKACVTGWRRIIADTELSVPGRLRDLIYLHGHRDVPDSWVMTRSQYEDFHRTKPVIVARTRQLLAQHPWLVVGFGMSDANFHALSRLLGAEMRDHQPLSLVLMRDLPPAAERQHWRRLGFVMAAPTHDGRDLGDFFAWALPKLATHYSPTSEAAEAYILRAPTQVERLRRFRLVNPPPILDREAAYAAWEKQLDGLLTEEERAAAGDAVEAASRTLDESRIEVNDEGRSYVFSPHMAPLSSSLLRAVDEDSTYPLATDGTVQCLDRLLSRDQNLRRELAEYFAWALQHDLFGESHVRPVMEVVAIDLARDAGWDAARIEGLIHTAFARVRKYEDASTVARLVRNVTRLGFTVPAPDVEATEPHLVEAKAGYLALMNGDFAEAAAHYGNAARIAASSGLDFEAWAYTTGHADALDASTEAERVSAPESDKDSSRGARALRDQAALLAQRPVVVRWLDRADKRLKSALRECVDDEATRERFRVTGNRGWRSSNAANQLWRTYRDLQAIHAPPSLQRRYIDTLGPFLGVDDVHVVIANLAKPQVWLSSLLRRAPLTMSERMKRDARLVEAFFGGDMPSVTKTEHLVTLECTRALISVLRTSDVPRALAWLSESVARYPEPWQQSAWGSRDVTEDYWAAFVACAYWAEPVVALDVARMLLNLDESARSTEAALEAFYELPWQAWMPSADRDTAGEFLELLTGLVPDGNVETGQSSRHGYAFFSLLRMMDAGLDVELLRPHVARWGRALDFVRSLPRSATHYSEAKRAGYLLERALQRNALVEAQGTLDLFDGWFGWNGDVIEDLDDREEIRLALAETLDGTTTSAGPLAERLVAEVEALVHDLPTSDGDEVAGDDVSSSIRLLVAGLQLLPSERPDIVPALLRLLETAPQHVSAIAGVLVRELWGDDGWDRLRALLVVMCGGGPASFGRRRREDPGLMTRCQRAVLSLFGKLDRRSFPHGENALWHTLQGFALASVNDERLAIAYAAAFAVVEAAEHAEELGEAKLYAAALHRIAADPRAQVRSAIAREGVGLASEARSTVVREAARAAVAEVHADANAQVATLLARAVAKAQARPVPPAPSQAPPAAGETDVQSAEELS